MSYIDQELARYRQHGGNVYGAGPKRKLIDIIRQHVAAEGGFNAAEPDAARIVQKLLEKVARHDTGASTAGADRMARQYGDFAERLDRRKATLTGASLVTRLGSLSSAIRAGDYRRGDRWRFSAKSLLKDVAFGVILKRDGAGSDGRDAIA